MVENQPCICAHFLNCLIIATLVYFLYTGTKWQLLGLVYYAMKIAYYICFLALLQFVPIAIMLDFMLLHSQLC